MKLIRHTLASESRTARVLHRCDICDDLIFPGDIYLLTVQIRDTGRQRYLWVRKEHESPLCPYPDDDPSEPIAYHMDVVSFPLAA